MEKCWKIVGKMLKKVWKNVEKNKDKPMLRIAPRARDQKNTMQFLTPSKAWMLKFLLGNAKTLNASVPIGVASDNLTTFSPVRSPRNRHGAAKKKREIKMRGKDMHVSLQIYPKNHSPCSVWWSLWDVTEPLYIEILGSDGPQKRLADVDLTHLKTYWVIHTISIAVLGHSKSLWVI